MKHRQTIKQIEKKVAPRKGGLIFAIVEDDGTLTLTSAPDPADKGRNVTWQWVEEKYPDPAIIFYGGRDCPLTQV